MSLLQTKQRLVVEASRDHGKSWVFSYAWPLFCIQKARDTRHPENIALISYSEDQARKNLARIRKAIESRESLKWLLPKSKAYVWESSMLNMSNESTIETFGFGSSMRGGHYTRIIIDDPTKDHFSMSPAEQQNFFYGVIIPALRRGGQMVVTGNPVDKQDMLETLENNAEFNKDLYKYPVINGNGQPLWPEQYTLEDIEARRRQIPAHIFSREYMLKRVSATDARFKEEWIRYYDPQKIENKPLYRVMTIDPAITPGGDALASIVTGTDSSDNTYVLERMGHRGELEQGLNLIVDMVSRHHEKYPFTLGIEIFAFQRMYKNLLEKKLKERGINIAIVELGKDSKKTKAMRIESLQPKLAQGKLFFRDNQRPLTDQIILWDPGSKHNDDDEIDALAWQTNLWRRPIDDTPVDDGEPVPGSILDELSQIQAERSQWMTNLFEDMNAANG